MEGGCISFGGESQALLPCIQYINQKIYSLWVQIKWRWVVVALQGKLACNPIPTFPPLSKKSSQQHTSRFYWWCFTWLHQWFPKCVSQCPGGGGGGCKALAGISGAACCPQGNHSSLQTGRRFSMADSCTTWKLQVGEKTLQPALIFILLFLRLVTPSESRGKRRWHHITHFTSSPLASGFWSLTGRVSLGSAAIYSHGSQMF